MKRKQAELGMRLNSAWSSQMSSITCKYVSETSKIHFWSRDASFRYYKGKGRRAGKGARERTREGLGGVEKK